MAFTLTVFITIPSDDVFINVKPIGILFMAIGWISTVITLYISFSLLIRIFRQRREDVQRRVRATSCVSQQEPLSHHVVDFMNAMCPLAVHRVSEMAFQVTVAGMLQQGHRRSPSAPVSGRCRKVVASTASTSMTRCLSCMLATRARWMR